jgi:Tfp pilus assembly protein PilN
MIRVNLLPPKEKERYQKEKTFKLIFILGFLVVVLLVTLNLVLLVVKTYILSQVEIEKILVERELKNTPQIESLQKEVNALNRTFSKLNSFYQEKESPTAVLEKISNLLLPGMYLESFSYKKKDFKVNISGWALTIEDLSQFRDNLKKEFKEVSFSLISQVKPKNISFQASILLKNGF